METIFQAEIPFRNSTHKPAKCAYWEGSITNNAEQLATLPWELLPRWSWTNHRPVRDVLSRRSSCANSYALFIKGISSWIIEHWLSGYMIISVSTQSQFQIFVFFRNISPGELDFTNLWLQSLELVSAVPILCFPPPHLPYSDFMC